MILDLKNELLRTKMDPFDFSNPPVKPWELVSDLIETLRHWKGLGLSANQVGLPYRVFVMDGSPPLACFNPRIVDVSQEEWKEDEGCLSFPGLFMKIKRPRVVKVRYQDADGIVHTEKFNGMTAKVFQHELDHLNGFLFYERANRLDRDRGFRQQKQFLRKNK